MNFASWNMPSGGCRSGAFKERKNYAAIVKVGFSPHFPAVW